MKTTTILLQNYDNLDSILDRLNQQMQSEDCAPRLLLIWPKRGRLLQDALEFAQVRDFAARSGRQLALIPNSEIVRDLAAEQRIPVFTQRSQAENADWKERNTVPAPAQPLQRARRLAALKESLESAQPPSRPRNAEIFFFVLALGVSLMLLYLVIPHASVQISPVRKQERVELSLWTNDTLQSLTINGGIPSQKEHLRLEISVTVPASGAITSNAAPAEGAQAAEYAAPTLADYQLALTQIAGQAEKDALVQIHERYGELRIVLADSLKMERIAEEHISPDFGYASTTLNVRQTLEVSLRTISRQDLDQLVKAMLAQQNSNEHLSDMTISDYEFITQPEEKDGQITWKAAANQSGYEVRTSVEAVRSLLKGKEIQKAQRILADIPHDGTPQIRLFPAWLGRMPLLGQNIRVEIVPVQEEP